MLELMRFIVARLSDFVGTHSCARRRAAHLPLSISPLDSKACFVGRRHLLTLLGYTRDISETGLSFIVPTIRFDDWYLIGQDRTLRITFELPTGPVNLDAAPVRYTPLDEGLISVSYLIGAHITQMSERDRLLYIEYLRTLR